MKTTPIILAFIAGSAAGANIVSKTSSSGSNQTTSQTSSNDSSVQLVRDGRLSYHKQATVRQAFEGTFQNPEWTSFVTNKGVTVVSFKGTIKMARLWTAGFYVQDEFTAPIARACGDKLGNKPEMFAEERKHGYAGNTFDLEYWLSIHPESSGRQKSCFDETPMPIEFQFKLSGDREFKLSYVDRILCGQYPALMGHHPGVDVLDFVYR
jgi:hypothetical protein